MKLETVPYEISSADGLVYFEAMRDARSTLVDDCRRFLYFFFLRLNTITSTMTADVSKTTAIVLSLSIPFDLHLTLMLDVGSRLHF